LDDYLSALYKILKYGGKIALILPKNVNNMPYLPEKFKTKKTRQLNMQQIEKSAIANDFEFKSKSFKYNVNWEKDEYQELLLKSPDFGAASSDKAEDATENEEDIGESLPPKIDYEDLVEVVLLLKLLDED